MRVQLSRFRLGYCLNIQRDGRSGAEAGHHMDRDFEEGGAAGLWGLR